MQEKTENRQLGDSMKYKTLREKESFSRRKLSNNYLPVWELDLTWLALRPGVVTLNFILIMSSVRVSRRDFNLFLQTDSVKIIECSRCLKDEFECRVIDIYNKCDRCSLYRKSCDISLISDDC